MYNLTTCFLLPLSGVDFDTISSPIYGFVNAYIDDHSIEERDEFKNSIILEFQPKDLEHFEMLAEKLRLRKNYIKEYDSETSSMFVFDCSFPYEEVKKPFIAGKYSEMSRDYVVKNFPEYYHVPDVDGEDSKVYNKNYLILTKSPVIKKDWEDRLGTSLPDEAEVWSKPKYQIEILNFSEEKMVDRVQLTNYMQWKDLGKIRSSIKSKFKNELTRI